ncbi:MAG TPA: hypothetical protein VLL95_16325 [Phnomibacter sp.]|nr:hypothetical protein [Phnomibacter sp.]
MKHFLKHSPTVVLLPAIIGLLLGSCKKETGGSGNASTFLPGNANSTWSYESKNFVNSTTGAFVMTKTSKDTVINGRTYKVYTISGGGNAYYLQSGSDYYQFSTFAGTTSKVELLYLKSNAASGATWDQDITIAIAGVGSVTAKLTSRVEAKGISYSVGGNAYSDVTQIKSTIGPLTIPGVPVPITLVSDITSYYANNVGRIYTRSKVNITIPTVPAINIDEETTLKSHNIVQ